jgi:hypothetical protein
MRITEQDTPVRSAKRHLRAWAAVLVILLRGEAIAGDHVSIEPGGWHFFERMSPAGGWHPDAGGLLHWWKPDCFPRCGGLDDYCRKPLPNVCWPPYPYYYIGQSRHFGSLDGAYRSAHQTP